MTEMPPERFNLPVEDRIIQVDLACARCAYNLRGLTRGSLCPECGSPVHYSIQGNWLRFADPEWLNRLRLGVACKLWGMLLGVLLEIGVALSVVLGVGPAAMYIAGLIGALFGLVAVFLITSPEPTIGTSEASVNLRKLIRACAVLGLVGNSLVQTRWFTVSSAAGILGWILSLGGTAALIGKFVYLRRFARRIPDPKLEGQTTVVMWGMVGVQALAFAGGLIGAIWLRGAAAAGGNPAGTAAGGGAPVGLIAVFGCFVGVGAIVFGIWNVILLFRYYTAFRQAGLWAGTAAQTGNSPEIARSADF